VTATPASYNADIKQLTIFSLTVTTDLKRMVEKDDLENEDSGKEEKLEKWQLSLIMGAVTLSILLGTVLVICRVNRDSKKRTIGRINGNRRARNQLQHDNFAAIAHEYAQDNLHFVL